MRCLACFQTPYSPAPNQAAHIFFGSGSLSEQLPQDFTVQQELKV